MKFNLAIKMRTIQLSLMLFFSCFTLLSQPYDAELIQHEVNIVISKAALTKTYSYSLQINNRAGEKYTKINIPFSKLIKLSKLQAHIIDKNGKKVKSLKTSDIVTKSSIANFSLYEDDFVQEFTLKHNEYPYVLQYSYVLQENQFLQIEYWMPIIAEKVPTRNAKLKLTIPLNYGIAYKNHLMDAPKYETTAKNIVYEWNTKFENNYRAEKFTAPMRNFYPTLSIVPLNFEYAQYGSLKDWTSFGNWQCNLLRGLDDLTADEKLKIDKLINGIESDKEKIRILYHYLQDNTRYVNTTIETGGLKPYPASYVVQNKYGDCKALTNYFKAVLSYVKIPSYYSKLNAGSNIYSIDKNFPSQQSNHVILYIPLRSEDIWLDCTSKFAFNYLGTFNQNRDAFVVDVDKSRFMRTPALMPNDVLETRVIETQMADNKTIVSFNNTYKGDTYENLLHISKNYNNVYKKRIISQHFVADGLQLIDYNLNEMHRDTTHIALTYTASATGIYKNYGNDVLLQNFAFDIDKLEKPQMRKLPVQINFPIFKIDTVVYQIPNGYKLAHSLVNINAKSTYGEYEMAFNMSDDKIIVTKKLLIKAGNYALDEYEAFYNFYTQIIENENKTHVSLSRL